MGSHTCTAGENKGVTGTASSRQNPGMLPDMLLCLGSP